MFLVYLVTNTVNGKRYVGQTNRSLARRWSQHCSSVGCCALSGAIQKYGKENFSIEPLFDVPTRELADEFEIEYIERYCTHSPNGYNLKSGGHVPVYSEESRKKMSASGKGRKSPREGVTLSEDTKKRISETKTGVKQPEWAIRKRVLSQIGGKRSEETKKKMSESAKLDWERRRASGYSVSIETRNKMSEAAKERWENRKIKPCLIASNE